MYRLACSPPQFVTLNTEGLPVALMGVLATLPSESLEQLLSGDRRIVAQVAARLSLPIDQPELDRLLDEARKSVRSAGEARRWAAGHLRSVLANETPTEDVKRALIPVVRLAAELALPRDLDKRLDGPLANRYREGLGEVVRYVAQMLGPLREGDAESSLLIHCLLDDACFGMPKWCDVLFENAIHAPNSFKGPPP